MHEWMWFKQWVNDVDNVSDLMTSLLGFLSQSTTKTLATCTTKNYPLFGALGGLETKSPLQTRFRLHFFPSPTKMQLKTLTAIVSIALTLGVHAVPNAFDRASGVNDVLKRSQSDGMDISQRDRIRDGRSDTKRDRIRDGRSDTKRDRIRDGRSDTKRDRIRDGRSDTKRDRIRDGRSPKCVLFLFSARGLLTGGLARAFSVALWSCMHPGSHQVPQSPVRRP
jgi:hypothetical protein